MKQSPLRWLVWPVILAGGSYLLLLALNAHLCTTQTLATLSGVSGFDFEIKQTDCDAVAKESWISVTASKLGDAHKTLLLEYDPIYYEPIPKITSLDEHTVNISVSRVAVLLFQKQKFETLTVRYDIGAVEFSKEQPKRE